MRNGYAFLFLSGSCGCFLKGTFYYYLSKLDKNVNPIKLTVNPSNGDCRCMFTGFHYHNFNEIVELKKESPDVKVIAISIEPDDLKIVNKMHYYKSTMFNNKANPDVIFDWQQQWNNSIDYTQIDLVIKFKTILGMSGEDLNQLLADYLQTEKLAEVDEFINSYREINKKLYINEE